MTAVVTSTDGAGKLDGPGIEQELFGQRRLTRIGVRDDRKGPPPRNLPLDLGERRGRGGTWWLIGDGSGGRDHPSTVHDCAPRGPGLGQGSWAPAGGRSERRLGGPGWVLLNEGRHDTIRGRIDRERGSGTCQMMSLRDGI